MTLRDAAKDAARHLRAAGVPDPEFEAEVLARTAAAVSRAEYFSGAAASTAELARLRMLIDRRLAREPAAYITGNREFFGREFLVGPGVLVPRPETELLVDIALRELAKAPASVVVDAGTGSGAVAVSVAAEVPDAVVIGTDVSPTALTTAMRNAARHAPFAGFVRCDLLDGLQKADIVLANLPYVPSEKIDALEPEVSRWEPRVALDGGEDGLRLIRRLITDCAKRVRPGLLALEVGFGQAVTVAAELAALGREPEVFSDLAGIERVVCTRWR